MEYEIGPEESLTQALVCATAACEACETCLYDPVHDVVDADAIESLFADRHDGRPRPGTKRLSIDTDACLLSVYAGDHVSITPFSESTG